MDTKRSKQKGKRKIDKVKSESSTAPKRRQVSDLTLTTSNLRLSSDSSSSYDLDNIPSLASKFTRRAVEAFNVSFKSAKAQNDVIPDVDSTYYAMLSFFLMNLMLII